ncbi:MAG TPA: four helix bundle protein [Fimbriimonadaceae bacterium]|jgi:four helix bundle protein
MSYSHRDLEVWQLGMDLVESVYQITAEFPTDERYGLTSQMRRASVSIPSNISEGWGRHSNANLANFLRIARGSHSEMDTLIELARRLNLVSKNDFDRLSEQMAILGRKMYSFLQHIEKTVVREERKPYDQEQLSPELVAALATFEP